ncbi:MAG: efflux RND transporter periplasmic adaptor subunit [Betaproteobacteria bacterium]|jgi:HlyD family secretion protein
MIRQPLLRYGLPLLAAGMLVFAILSSTSLPHAETLPPAAEPARSPFSVAVSGLGVVEPNSELVAIGTHLPGIIAAMHVRAGQRVRAGEALFTIDDRDVRARLEAEQARLESARVLEADAARQYALFEAVSDRRAITQDELDRRRYAVETARKGVAEVEARLRVLRTEMERHTVRAPIAGAVLRLNARNGEFAPAGALAEPLLQLGNIEPLHVRVEIDETDLSRFDPAAVARASLRGNARSLVTLEYVRSEPLVRAKRTLTGDGNERVDTRVLQVIYAVRDAGFAVHVGQQVDVYVEAGRKGEPS